jgi:L-alanine-DL-glutamate epimerase-like enolase superfamily enzyme
MKITDLKVHVLEWARPPHHWRDGLPRGGPKGRETLLRILTDEGVEGHSTHWGDANIDEIKWKLVGRDPLRIEEIWQDLWRNLRSSTIGGAIANCRYFESLQPEGFFIPPGTHTASTEIAPDGTVGPWEKPGLGMEIDWPWIDAHTIRTIE